MPQATEAGAVHFGLPRAAIDAINWVFEDYPTIRRVVLYGSRAKGSQRPGSDIDLAIVGPEVTQSQLLEIENRLDDLLLPYKMDVSLYHEIRNADLVDHIRRVGVTFYPFPNGQH